MITLKDAQRIASAVGMTIRHDNGYAYDYRVIRKGDRNPTHGYYTDDLQDAVDTAIQMSMEPIDKCQ